MATPCVIFTDGYVYSAMIFLQDNVYLKRDLKFDDIKPRLLGQFSFFFF